RAVRRDAVAEAAVDALELAGATGLLRQLLVAPDAVDQYAHGVTRFIAVIARIPNVVIARASGQSSIHNRARWLLDRPRARAMTRECVAAFGISLTKRCGRPAGR